MLQGRPGRCFNKILHHSRGAQTLRDWANGAERVAVLTEIVIVLWGFVDRRETERRQGGNDCAVRQITPSYESCIAYLKWLMTLVAPASVRQQSTAYRLLQKTLLDSFLTVAFGGRLKGI